MNPFRLSPNCECINRTGMFPGINISFRKDRTKVSWNWGEERISTESHEKLNSCNWLRSITNEGKLEVRYSLVFNLNIVLILNAEHNRLQIGFLCKHALRIELFKIASRKVVNLKIYFQVYIEYYWNTYLVTSGFSEWSSVG